jgi:hypothetical protein
MLLKTIQTEVDSMAPDVFARERLGWWPPIIEKEDVEHFVELLKEFHGE